MSGAPLELSPKPIVARPCRTQHTFPPATEPGDHVPYGARDESHRRLPGIVNGDHALARRSRDGPLLGPALSAST